jgi:predicted lipoprotein with Yx(FWY)xxD motif
MYTTLYASDASPRIWCTILLFAALVVLLAACGGTRSGSGTVSTTGGTTPTTSNSSNGGGGRYGYGGGTNPTANTSGSDIKTATVAVNGKSESILTNAQGLTLYYRTSDAPPSTVCSGGCASAWPPLVMSGSSTPASIASLPGKLTLVADAKGNQVEYNGHPLYTHSGDTAAGQTNGEGVAGVWYVVTPSLT